jgi:nucleotidyltransferase substrate binding protein (TIGR01987 family)
MNSVYSLDLSSIEKAIASLDEAVIEHKKNLGNTFVRDAAIQRFKYTYELSHKMLRRFLEMTEPNAEEIDQMSFPNLIRTGSERGLMLSGWDVWKVFRDARHLTSHTYKASEVCKIIPIFFQDAKHLLAQLKGRIAAEETYFV